MALWKIVPVVARDDARWLGHPDWNEVMVRAQTAALARVLAAGLERGEAPDKVPAGNESLSFTSGFEDEQLYMVRRQEPEEAPGLVPVGPDEVVRATKAIDKAVEASRRG